MYYLALAITPLKKEKNIFQTSIFLGSMIVFFLSIDSTIIPQRFFSCQSKDLAGQAVRVLNFTSQKGISENETLGGDFKYFLFSTLFGEDSNF